MISSRSLVALVATSCKQRTQRRRPHVCYAIRHESYFDHFWPDLMMNWLGIVPILEYSELCPRGEAWCGMYIFPFACDLLWPFWQLLKINGKTPNVHYPIDFKATTFLWFHPTSEIQTEAWKSEVQLSCPSFPGCYYTMFNSKWWNYSSITQKCHSIPLQPPSCFKLSPIVSPRPCCASTSFYFFKATKT